MWTLLEGYLVIGMVVTLLFVRVLCVRYGLSTQQLLVRMAQESGLTVTGDNVPFLFEFFFYVTAILIWPRTLKAFFPS
jgi:hypothetical protein